MLVNGELYDRKRLLEEQQNWKGHLLAARYDPVFHSLLENLEVRHILETKIQTLAQEHIIVMGGDSTGPSFLLNSGSKYVLSASYGVRVARITNTWKMLGIPMSRSDIRPEVAQQDDTYMKRYHQLNMSYLGNETVHSIESLPRVYPVRSEYWDAMPHLDAATRPFVVNTNVLTAYEVAKLIKPNLPIIFHKDDLHNWIMF